MHHVKKSEKVPYSAAEMFGLVADVGQYKEFLPWCSGSRVLSQHGEDVVAEIEVAYGPVRTSFRTKNKNYPNKMIEMHLLEGALQHLHGSWQFESLAEGGTKVTLDLQFRLNHGLIATLEEKVLQEATETMVSAFKERAREVYGARSQ